MARSQWGVVDRLRRIHRIRAVIGCAVLLAMNSAGPAAAGGSISLEDALVQSEVPPGLHGEIEAALIEAGLTLDQVICDGARFGRHWVHLGGARTLPFACPVGGRLLVMEGTTLYRDGAGGEVSEDEAMTKAETFQSMVESWSWEENPQR